MKKVSINRKEGTILPLNTDVNINPVTKKIKSKHENARPIEDKIINGITYKMRTDINAFCKDRFQANILRVIILNQGKFHFTEINGLNIIVDEDGKLFNHKSAYVLVDINPSEKTLNIINDFRINNKLYLITSEKINYQWQPYEMNRTYEWFEKKYKPNLALWETTRQNVDTTPDLYKRHWVIGKRELKRKHKKFFQPEGKSVKIGQLWIKQPFKGRPYYDKMFMDTFKIFDSETNDIIFVHDNWGSIIMKVRQYMKDNAYEYYNNNRCAICSGHVKKTNEWVDIVRYNTMTNTFINTEHFC